MRYSEQVIEEVRLKSSLSELVSERTEVRRSGTSLTACCPFHSEKTPSFHINEDQGLYYCFGCGKKGNTYTFVMETRGLSFPEAVKYLAQKYSVPLPALSAATQYEKGLAKKKSILRRVLFETQNMYEDILWGRNRVSNQAEIARDFLEKRQLSEQTLKRYRVGFTGGTSGYLLGELKKSLSRSISVQDNELKDALVTLGLVKTFSNNRMGELFRERVMFPIPKSDGNPIAFGGRIITANKELPKYINSPESPVYEKRRSFYGLPQGLPSIQKSRTVYIVEGYTDVLAFHQAGIENTLAVCGTALTEDHTKILSRFVSRAYLVFDGDAAGRTASARSFLAFMNSGIEAIPVFLPEGEDPDSLARRTFNGTSSLEDLLKILSEGESSLLKVYLQSTAASLIGLERGSLAELSDLKASEHGKLAESVASQLILIKNPVEKELRVKEVCTLLGVSDTSFRNILQVTTNTNQRNNTNTSSTQTNTNKQRPTRPSFSSKPYDNEPAQTVENEASDQTIFSKRMFEMKKQMIVAILVDPSIFKSESVYQEALEICKGDTNCTALFEIIRQLQTDTTINSKYAGGKGLSELISNSKSDANSPSLAAAQEEILAEFHGILSRCGMEKDGYLEEAVKQITHGASGYPELVSALKTTVERIHLHNKVDSLRLKESGISDQDEKIRLIQEKLLMKRSLDKLKSKEN